MLRTSERGQLNRCRQRWAWSYDELLRPKLDAPALRFGTLIHKALEHYYGAKNQARRNPIHPSVTFERLYNEELEATRKVWSKWRDENDEWHNYMELGIAMLEGYLVHWKNASAHNEREYVTLATEQRFIMPIIVPDGQPPLGLTAPKFYVGTFDRVLYHLATRRLLFGDYKTTVNDPTKNKHLALDEQAGAYWAYGPDWLLKYADSEVTGTIRAAAERLSTPMRNDVLKALRNCNFDGILYDFMKKGLPDDRPKNARGLALNKDGSISKQQPGPLFHREVCYRDEGDRQHVIERIYYDAQEIGKLREGTEPVKKSPDRFICIGCQFYDMCELHETGAEGWEEFQRQMYTTYDPYDTYYIDWDELQ